MFAECLVVVGKDQLQSFLLALCISVRRQTQIIFLLKFASDYQINEFHLSSVVIRRLKSCMKTSRMVKFFILLNHSNYTEI